METAGGSLSAETGAQPRVPPASREKDSNHGIGIITAIASKVTTLTIISKPATFITHTPCCYSALSISPQHAHSHPFDKLHKCTVPETFLCNRGTCNVVSHCELYRACESVSQYYNADKPGVVVVGIISSSLSSKISVFITRPNGSLITTL